MSFISIAILGSGVLGAGANIFSGFMQSNAARQAQTLLQSLMQQGAGYIQGAVPPAVQAIEQFGAQGAAALQPFVGAGQAVLPTLQGLLTPGPDMTNLLQQMPGFQFAKDIGTQTAINQGSTTGYGGNVATGLERFGTGLASQTYNTLVDQLRGTAGMGATAAGGLGTLLSGIGTGVGGVYTGAANQLATLFGNMGPQIGQAGIGSATALGAGLTGGVNALSNPLMMMALMGGGRGAGGGGFGGLFGGGTANTAGQGGFFAPSFANDTWSFPVA